MEEAVYILQVFLPFSAGYQTAPLLLRVGEAATVRSVITDVIQKLVSTDEEEGVAPNAMPEDVPSIDPADYTMTIAAGDGSRDNNAVPLLAGSILRQAPGMQFPYMVVVDAAASVVGATSMHSDDGMEATAGPEESVRQQNEALGKIDRRDARRRLQQMESELGQQHKEHLEKKRLESIQRIERERREREQVHFERCEKYEIERIKRIRDKKKEEEARRIRERVEAMAVEEAREKARERLREDERKIALLQKEQIEREEEELRQRRQEVEQQRAERQVLLQTQRERAEQEKRKEWERQRAIRLEQAMEGLIAGLDQAVEQEKETVENALEQQRARRALADARRQQLGDVGLVEDFRKERKDVERSQRVTETKKRITSVEQKEQARKQREEEERRQEAEKFAAWKASKQKVADALEAKHERRLIMESGGAVSQH